MANSQALSLNPKELIELKAKPPGKDPYDFYPYDFFWSLIFHKRSRPKNTAQ
jgi:hypothetical protein